MDWGAIATGVAGVTSAVVAVDHYLAAAKRFIPNSAWQFFWALVTKKPIRAAGSAGGGMQLLDDLEKVIVRMEELGQRGVKAAANLAQVVESVAPLAKQLAPLLAAPEVEAITGAAEKVSELVETAAEEIQGAGPGSPSAAANATAFA